MDPRVSFDVAGKHVLISGGCGGIGSAFARAFAAAGARVTVTDRKAPGPELVADNQASLCSGRVMLTKSDMSFGMPR